MPPNGFNVFDYVDELKEAGLPGKQADIFARAFQEMASASAATKQDLEVIKMELKRDIENVKAELKRDIETVKAELKRDITELELKIKASQNTQTFQLIGAMAALIGIFKFLPIVLQ